MSEEFNYVIGIPWNQRNSDLYKHCPDDLMCVYTFGGQESHRGNMENAKWLLKYVHSKGEEYKDFKIYKVKFEEIENN